jgi:hypothetical protein
MRMEEEKSNLRSKGTPYRTDIPTGYILGTVLLKVFTLADNDLSNNVVSINRMTNLLDYTTAFLINCENISDKKFIVDLSASNNIPNIEDKNKAVFMAISAVLDRRKLLMKSERTEHI